jgi:hypothetical protein
MSVPEQVEMRYVVDCFRLHMIVNLLAHAHVKQYGESDITKLLTQGEERLHLVDSAPPT